MAAIIFEVENVFASNSGPFSFLEVKQFVSSSMDEQELVEVLRSLEDSGKICSKCTTDGRKVYCLETAGSPQRDLKALVSNKITPKCSVTPGLSDGRRKTPVFRSNKKLRQPFKSPFQANQSPPNPDGVCTEEVESLKKKLKLLTEEVDLLQQEYHEDELQLHIDKMHEYNEIKDTGQLLIGKLAELEGKTTKSMYEDFGLDLED